MSTKIYEKWFDDNANLKHLTINQHGIGKGKVGYTVSMRYDSVELTVPEMRELVISLNTFLLNKVE